jgi:hypothetical protein
LASAGAEYPPHCPAAERDQAMKDIYLHIGRGKTGTTLIQAQMSQSRAELKDLGLHYVVADDAGRGVGHQQFAKSFIADLPPYMTPPVEPARVREAVREEICEAGDEVIVMSSENFPLADIPALARYFADLPVANRVKVVFFVRTQDEVAESEYNQMVKLKRETRPFRDYIEQALDGVEYFEEARRWEACFGRENIICRVYDGARRDVVRQFLSCLPVPQAALDAMPIGDLRARGNASIGLKALAATRLLNMIEMEGREALYQGLFDRFAESDPPAVLFSAEGARAFRARFSTSNARFSQRYLDHCVTELPGRRYCDADRDALCQAARALGIGLIV